MAVFDLMRSPAIVLTANGVFCSMLGYQYVHKSSQDLTNLGGDPGNAVDKAN